MVSKGKFEPRMNPSKELPLNIKSWKVKYVLLKRKKLLLRKFSLA